MLHCFASCRWDSGSSCKVDEARCSSRSWRSTTLFMGHLYHNEIISQNCCCNLKQKRPFLDHKVLFYEMLKLSHLLVEKLCKCKLRSWNKTCSSTINPVIYECIHERKQNQNLEEDLLRELDDTFLPENRFAVQAKSFWSSYGSRLHDLCFTPIPSLCITPTHHQKCYPCQSVAHPPKCWPLPSPRSNVTPHQCYPHQSVAIPPLKCCCFPQKYHPYQSVTPSHGCYPSS